MENLLAVHAVNIHDTKGGVFTFEKALFYYPSIQGVCADNAYRKHFKNNFEVFHNIGVDISKLLTFTFEVMPELWKIERTFSWLCHSIWLSKDYEICTFYAESIVIISHVHTLIIAIRKNKTAIDRSDIIYVGDNKNVRKTNM